jgi:hypothetical protein
MTRPKMSFRTLFFVIPSVSEESTHGCFASLSMTNWWMLHFIQHDKTEDVIPSVSEESTHGCFTSLSMTRPKMSFRASVRNPAHGCFASLSMTNWWMLRFVRHDRPKMSFRTLFFVIPSVSEESSTWMLRCAQHDKLVDASLRSA